MQSHIDAVHGGRVDMTVRVQPVTRRANYLRSAQPAILGDIDRSSRAGARQSCPICNYRTPALAAHMAAVHDDHNYTPPAATAMATSTTTSTLHADIDRGTHARAASVRESCPICGFTSPNIAAHMEAVHADAVLSTAVIPPSPRRQAGFAVVRHEPSVATAFNSVASRGSRQTCSICSFATPDLAGHMRAVHDQELEEEAPPGIDKVLEGGRSAAPTGDCPFCGQTMGLSLRTLVWGGGSCALCQFLHAWSVGVITGVGSLAISQDYITRLLLIN